MIYKIKFIARSIHWWSSFPSSLQEFFTVTNSKDCPNVDGEKIQLNATYWTPISNVSMPSLWFFCRSTTGGLQIALPTGLSRQACWDFPAPPSSHISGICKNLADTWPAATRVLSRGRKREDPGNEVAPILGLHVTSSFFFSNLKLKSHQTFYPH